MLWATCVSVSGARGDLDGARGTKGLSFDLPHFLGARFVFVCDAKVLKVSNWELPVGVVFFHRSGCFVESPHKCFHESLKHIFFFYTRHKNEFLFISKSSLWKKIYGLGGVRMEILYISDCERSALCVLWKYAVRLETEWKAQQELLFCWPPFVPWLACKSIFTTVRATALFSRSLTPIYYITFYYHYYYYYVQQSLSRCKLKKGIIIQHTAAASSKRENLSRGTHAATNNIK